MRKIMLYAQRNVVLVLVLLVFSGCAGYQPGNLEQASSGFNLVGESDEIAFGFAASQQMEAQADIITDPVVQAYIDDLGNRLIEGSRRSNITYQFRVLDTDEINACAYPGGFVYINRGLITAVDNEAELAGVVAHEIGHVAAKHGARQLTKTLLLQAGLLTLQGLTEDEQDQQMYLALGELLTQGLLMKYSRDDERQADDLAVETLYKVGYDPVVWIDFMERLSQGHAEHFDLLQSTHPNTPERVQNVHATYTMNFTPTPYTTDTPEFQQVKRRLQQPQTALSSQSQTQVPAVQQPDQQTSPSDGIYGAWHLQWTIDEMQYESILIMQGETGGTRTVYSDPTTNQQVSVDQDMQLVIEEGELFLAGSNPRFSESEKPYTDYSPDNFALQLQSNGPARITKICDAAGNCAEVQSKFLKETP